MNVYEAKSTRIDLNNGTSHGVTLAPGRVEIEARYVADLYNAGLKVQAIKHARSVLEVGLKFAKEFAEDVARDVTKGARKPGPDQVGRVVSCDHCGWRGADDDQTRCPSCGASYDFSRGAFA